MQSCLWELPVAIANTQFVLSLCADFCVLFSYLFAAQTSQIRKGSNELHGTISSGGVVGEGRPTTLLTTHVHCSIRERNLRGERQTQRRRPNIRRIDETRKFDGSSSHRTIMIKQQTTPRTAAAPY